MTRPTAFRCSPRSRSRLAVFFLQMVDHLFRRVALPLLAAAPLGPAKPDACWSIAPLADIDLDDATKVRLRPIA